MPWKLLSSYGTYVFGWLVGYSGLLGPIAGILIADYWVVRKRELNVDDLYKLRAFYYFINDIKFFMTLTLTSWHLQLDVGANTSTTVELTGWPY